MLTTPENKDSSEIKMMNKNYIYDKRNGCILLNETGLMQRRELHVESLEAKAVPL